MLRTENSNRENVKKIIEEPISRTESIVFDGFSHSTPRYLRVIFLREYTLWRTPSWKISFLKGLSHEMDNVFGGIHGQS
jgi:hypothetical protein